MPVSIPSANGALSSTATFGGDAHNGAHGRTLGVFRSVKAYGAKGDNATDDYTAVQNCINESQPGDTILFGDGIYQTSAPWSVPCYRYIRGSMWAANNASGNARSQVKVRSGATLATWGRKGVFTHAAYLTPGAIGDDEGPIYISDLYINGNSQANAGAGVVFMGSCNIIERCLINNFTGTTDWAETASTSGSGYGVVWTTKRYNGETHFQNAVNSWFKQLRIGSNNASVFIQKAGVGGGITDWVMDDIVCLRPPDYTHAKDDIRIEAAGGALIRHIHTNGSAGSGIHVIDAGMLRISECYLDGFGCGNGSGVYGAIQVDGNAGFDGGAGGGNSISDCNVNHRQVGTGVTCVTLDINMTNAAEWSISGVTSHVQSTAGSHYFADISGSSGQLTMVNCVANTNLVSNIDGAGNPNKPFGDATIFRSSLTGVDITCEGNSWQKGSSTPASGQWANGMKRWRSPAATGQPMGWVCTTGGSPGTWTSMGNL